MFMVKLRGWLWRVAEAGRKRDFAERVCEDGWRGWNVAADDDDDEEEEDELPASGDVEINPIVRRRCLCV